MQLKHSLVGPQLWTDPSLYANKIVPFKLGYPLLYTKIIMYRHVTPVRQRSPQLWTQNSLHKYIRPDRPAGVSTTLDENPRTKHIRPVRLGYQQLWTKIPLRSISGQLGWGVHNFGHKSPYKAYAASWARVSTTLDEKIPYKNITRRLGWGVCYYGPNNPIYKHYIMPVRLGCPLRWTKTLKTSTLCQTS